MGSLISKVKICLSAWYPVRARVLLLGLDHSGKTTTLYQLKLKEKVATISTVGFNVETLEPINGVSFTVWDVSLNTQTWPFYKHYFANTQGMIYVVDCKDGERHADAKQLLHMILGETDMEGVPFIILANKQDLQETKQPSELALELELDKWTGHAWEIFGCSAMSGDGLQKTCFCNYLYINTADQATGSIASCSMLSHIAHCPYRSMTRLLLCMTTFCKAVSSLKTGKCAAL